MTSNFDREIAQENPTSPVEEHQESESPYERQCDSHNYCSHQYQGEVQLHNTPSDIWVSIRGKVFDLTKLVVEYEDKKALRPLLASAGKDISHWFDKNGEHLVTCVSQVTGAICDFLPHGPVPDCNEPLPSARWTAVKTPWWRDEERYMIGLLTEKVRRVRIFNMLTQDEVTIEVATEETLNEIRQRYLSFNNHAGSYTWKFGERKLDMNRTLAENQVDDLDDDLASLGLNEHKYLPALFLYYNDDLTEL